MKKIKINKRDSCSDELFVGKRSPFFFAIFFLHFNSTKHIKKFTFEACKKTCAVYSLGVHSLKKILNDPIFVLYKKIYSPFHTNNTKKKI